MLVICTFSIILMFDLLHSFTFYSNRNTLSAQDDSSRNIIGINSRLARNRKLEVIKDDFHQCMEIRAVNRANEFPRVKSIQMENSYFLLIQEGHFYQYLITTHTSVKRVSIINAIKHSMVQCVSEVGETSHRDKFMVCCTPLLRIERGHHFLHYLMKFVS